MSCDLERARLRELDLAFAEGEISLEEYQEMVRGNYALPSEKKEGLEEDE